MPLNHDEQYQAELKDVENKMTTLASKISDKEFLDNPIKKFTNLQKSADAQKKVLDDEGNKRQALFDSLNNAKLKLSKKHSKSLLDNLDKLIIDAEEQGHKIDLETEKYNQLRNELNTITDDDHKKYQKLFLVRYNIKKKLNINQDEVTHEIKCLCRSAKGENSISLCDNMADILKNQNKWYENFQNIHKFELSTPNPDGLTNVEFTNKKGECIQISEDSVRFKGKITTATMHDIVPAMIALYLKSTENSNICGCNITEEEPEVTRYMEGMLARELMKRSPNNSTYLINNASVQEILKRSSMQPDVPISTAEPIQECNHKLQ